MKKLNIDTLIQNYGEYGAVQELLGLYHDLLQEFVGFELYREWLNNKEAEEVYSILMDFLITKLK